MHGRRLQIVLDAADAVGLSGSSSVVGSVISVAASDLALHGSSYLSTDGLGSAGSAHTRSTAACNSSARMPMMPSDACECSLAAASLGLEYADVADVEWPQGCIVRADSAYFCGRKPDGEQRALRERRWWRVHLPHAAVDGRVPAGWGCELVHR